MYETSDCVQIPKKKPHKTHVAATAAVEKSGSFPARCLFQAGVHQVENIVPSMEKRKYYFFPHKTSCK